MVSKFGIIIFGGGVRVDSAEIAEVGVGETTWCRRIHSICDVDGLSPQYISLRSFVTRTSMVFQDWK